MPKYVEDSRTEQMHIVRPTHLNGVGRLFGGQLALWIDEVAGVTALRHCGSSIVTASIDNLRFREPVFQNEILFLIGRPTYVGNTSMEVRVDSFVEALSGCRKLINTAFVTLVALDDDGKPRTIPPLVCRTPQEEAEFAAGEKRRALRIQLSRGLYD